MGLKELKEYGLKFKDVKAMAVALNKTELVDPIPVKVGIKGGDMLSNFMDAIEGVPKKKVKDIPEDVSEFYDALPQGCFDDDGDAGEEAEGAEGAEETEETENAAEEITSECPAFLTGCDDDEAECTECKSDMPKEYKACKEAVAKAAKSKKKKTTTSKKKAGKRTRYGHMPGSMSGRVDDMVFEGTTKVRMVETLMDEFGREEKQASGKVTAHLKRLTTKLSIEVKEKKDGTLKAKQKYAEGYTKENTTSGTKE